jgi:hypothetical protein
VVKWKCGNEATTKYEFKESPRVEGKRRGKERDVGKLQSRSIYFRLSRGDKCKVSIHR